MALVPGTERSRCRCLNSIRVSHRMDTRNLSYRESFYQALVRLCRVDVQKCETGKRQYLFELMFSAFHAASNREHQKIHELAMMRRAVVG